MQYWEIVRVSDGLRVDFVPDRTKKNEREPQETTMYCPRNAIYKTAFYSLYHTFKS